MCNVAGVVPRRKKPLHAVKRDWQTQARRRLTALWVTLAAGTPTPSRRDDTARLFPLLDILEPMATTVAGFCVELCAGAGDGGILGRGLVLPERIALVRGGNVNRGIMAVRAALAATTAARLVGGRVAPIGGGPGIVEEARAAARDLEAMSPILGAAVEDAWRLCVAHDRLALLTGTFVEPDPEAAASEAVAATYAVLNKRLPDVRATASTLRGARAALLGAGDGVAGVLAVTLLVSLAADNPALDELRTALVVFAEAACAACVSLEVRSAAEEKSRAPRSLVVAPRAGRRVEKGPRLALLEVHAGALAPAIAEAQRELALFPAKRRVLLVVTDGRVGELPPERRGVLTRVVTVGGGALGRGTVRDPRDLAGTLASVLAGP